jgi:hypothetical protein
MTARIRSALLATACCSIWAISLIDTLAFRRWAAECVADAGSLNAGADLDWANFLLATVAVARAVVGLVVGRALAGRAARHQEWVLLGMLGVGAWFLVRDPAHPIHLLPAVEVVPVMPAVLVCGLLAASRPWSLRGGAMPPAGPERPERDWQARRADRHA